MLLALTCHGHEKIVSTIRVQVVDLFRVVTSAESGVGH